MKTQHQPWFANAPTLPGPVPQALPVEDLTVPHQYTFVPSLQEVEAAVAVHEGMSIAYYDPTAAASAPWLWLQNTNGIYKIYAAMDASELAKYLYQISTTARDQRGQYSFVRKSRRLSVHEVR